MKKRFLIILFAGIIAFAFAKTFIYSSKAYSYMAKGGDYKKEWAVVDSLEGQELNKSALDLVIKIYNKAKLEGNAAQFVKAVIYRMKLESQFEEFSLEKSIYKLQEETKNSTYPIKPVLHSILAESYWRYYEANRWQTYERSQTTGFKNDDIATWDINKIVNEVILNYQLSLEDAEKSKATPIDVYDAIVIHTKDFRNLRPTLFDFLGHRALDFYMNQEPEVIHPSYKFSVSDESFFNDAEAFAINKYKTEDTLSLKFYAVNVLQQLTAFHLKDNNIDALIDVDLKRLNFVKANSGLSNKEDLYLAALENLEKKYIDSPASTEVTYSIANHFQQLGTKYNPDNGDEHKWEIKKAYEICQKGIDRFPKSFGADNCRYLQANIKAKSVSVICEEVNVPDMPSRTLVNYKNLQKIFVRVAKLNDQLKGRNANYEGTEVLLKKYLDLKPVLEFSTTLPDDGDYQNHSVEIKIPKLEKGNYVILTGTDERFNYTEKNAVAYQQCWVSSLSFFSRRAAFGNYEFYIVDRESGAPKKNVTAQLWHEKYDYNTSKYEYVKGDKFTSNDEGYFSVKADTESKNYDVEFIDGNDRLHCRNALYLYSYNDREEKQKRTFIFTDRAIYRPGQTVYFKGIMLEKNGESNKILSKENTTVIFYDVNHQKITEQQFTTNEYGTFNGTFTIPQGLLNGQMSITNKNGSAYFSVEDYKRPKFDAQMDPVKGSYKLNQEIKVTGSASAYSGANIDGAKVSYRVVRGVSYPAWFYWQRRHYNYNTDETEILNGTTETNDTGGFVINFKALPDPNVTKEGSPDYYFYVYVDVTDLNGETHSTSTSVRISYKAIELVLGIPTEMDLQNISDLSLSSQNMSGSFEPAKGTVIVYKLKEPKKVLRTRYWEKPDRFLMSEAEYSALFPHDEYSNELDKFKWEKEKKIVEQPFDTKKSTVLLLDNIKKWEPGTYFISAVCKDAFGEDVKTEHYFTLFTNKQGPLSTPKTAIFKELVNSGEPGTVAKFLIGSGYENVKILYEVEHKNKIVKKEWLTLSNEQKVVEIPIEEKHRGNLAVHFTFIVNNRPYRYDGTIYVPYSNKDLKISFETFRNKLLPGQNEEWKLKITGPKGEKVAAEMLATLYDASLDVFRGNYWSFNIYDSYYASLGWQNNIGFNTVNSTLYGYNWNSMPSIRYKEYEQLNWFGYSNYYGRYGYGSKRGDYAMDFMNAAPASLSAPDQEVSESKSAEKAAISPRANRAEYTISPPAPPKEKPTNAEGSPAPRKNFNETAFFYPTLQTNEQGEVIVKFTVPEALTKWRMMGFAHTKDLMFGQIGNELVTQKDLMVVPNTPRFFRENDTILFTSKISNLSETEQNGIVKLELFDAITMKPLSIFVMGDPRQAKNMSDLSDILVGGGEQKFSTKKGGSAVATWAIKIPEGVGAITYRVSAKGTNHSDAEEMTIPVLTNRMLVTESLPLPIRSKQTKTFSFDKLISQSNGSKTLRNHKLTLEFTSNPAWYAIQALPYLMEYPYECAEQTFSRYYANSIASHIANSSPKIKAVFDSWKNQDPNALLSNLEKNQELKALMLEETPWVLQSKDETERKKRVALLFDLNKMSNELNSALTKLQQMQASNGAWPWFKGMPEDRYISQHIVAGMGHLDKLGITNVRTGRSWNMITNAIQYMDNQMDADYKYLKKEKLLASNNLSYSQIHYLYARSFFKDIEINGQHKEAFNYYIAQAKQYWPKNSRYMEGMIALALHRFDDKKTPLNIIAALKENSLENEEMGMYWKENYEGYYWYQAPVEAQAMMIEAFDEVANDKKSVDGLRVWLLKSKQTEDWRTTKATAKACYALLLRGTQWLDTDVNVEITLGTTKVDPKKLPDTKIEAGSGYFKTSWSGSDIKPEMGKVTITKTNEGVSWGALYWQYFEQLDKITPHETPLKLKKQLFKEINTDRGPVISLIDSKTKLNPGDKIKVRIELRVDRDMEYVHLKDMRASAFEPVNVFSGYKWQDGLGYYESTRDAATNFFFSYLYKGTYVFEYPLLVTHHGNFSNGVATIQCMYAPEFTSHSEGIRVNIAK